MEIALLVARLYFGLGLFGHGAQKLFGWFGGYGLDGTGGFFEQLGFRPGRLFALAAGLGEAGGGLLLALGLLGPVGPAIMITVMLVATITVHMKQGFFVAGNGIEMPLLYAAAALVFAFTGPGPFSLDGLLGLGQLTTSQNAVYAVAAAAVLAALSLLARRPQQVPQVAAA